MSQIRLNHICKSYQGTDLAVKDFNLDIGEKEFIFAADVNWHYNFVFMLVRRYRRKWLTTVEC